ncbi:MAG: NUDIX domain-containing protein [Pseudomonadota bacterium]|uniref:NUDIX hydrolase n=1 Tax=Tardiphaga sp. TaxID=1926292 RepID=UPI00334F8ECA
MRRRPSARLLIVNDAGSVLLFRYTHRTGPLAGDDYWATPGGGVEPGEQYEQAAIRELREETGLIRASIGDSVADREQVVRMPDGEYVICCEKYFVVRANELALTEASWTAIESDVIADMRWWSETELLAATDTVWPANLPNLLVLAR